MKGMFKCPVCKRLHPINTNAEGLDEMNCTDNFTSEIRNIKGYRDVSTLEKGGWNFNSFDRLTNGYSNDAELENISLNNPHPRRVTNW